MNIDVTQLAERQGITPPRIQFGPLYGIAAYDGEAHELLVDLPRATNPFVLFYMEVESRFPADVRSRLDRVRWIVAHEMGHAVQRHSKTLDEWEQMVANNKRQINVGGAHTAGDLERKADRFAHANWRHVRINGHGPRSAAR